MAPATGNVLTVDNAAVRLWSLNRQIKSSHIAAEKSAANKAVAAFYLSELDQFCVVYSAQRAVSDDSDDEEDVPLRGGTLQLWSSSLHLQQEVQLDTLEHVRSVHPLRNPATRTAAERRGDLLPLALVPLLLAALRRARAHRSQDRPGTFALLCGCLVWSTVLPRNAPGRAAHDSGRG